MPRANRPKPWREVVRLRPELKTGELTLAEFAADLHEVASSLGRRPVYEDPEKFFGLTFATHALRDLVRDVAERLAGQSDKAVRQLELTYGGGKTHTLITLHHLFREPGALPDLPAVREFRGAVGFDLPKAFVASLSFDKIDVEQGLEGVPGPGGARRNLRHPWSILAWQLAGDDGLRRLHAEGLAEERETPPAEPLLADLIERPGRDGLATLILVDEVLMYARAKAGLDALWRNRIVDFFQYLTQAVSKVDRAAMVASLLATDPKKQSGTEGKQLMHDLFSIFRRQKEEGVQPVAKEDVAEVLRRRFFLPEDLADHDATRARAIGAVRVLKRFDDRIRRNAKQEEERFHRSYPFHPDLTEVFYSRWTQLEGFQRTRGMLRTLAIGLREAEKWDRCPVIGPGVLLAAPEPGGGGETVSRALSELAGVATSEATKAKRIEWKQLLEAELARARQAQTELPALGPGREVEQAVAAVFLHSQPPGSRASTPELKRLVATASPDAIELDKGLRRWRDLSWFLDDEEATGDDGAALPTSWRLGNRPNLKQMHDEAVKQRVSGEAVEERLVATIRKAKKRLTGDAKSAGAEVHLLPARPADLPDNVKFRFAVLGPEAVSESGKPGAVARRFLREKTGPDAPRVHRNAVVLAVPSRLGLRAARDAARDLLGWEEVSSQLARVKPVDLVRRQRLRRNLDTATRTLGEQAEHAYEIVVATDRKDRVKAFRLPPGQGTLFARIREAEKSRIQATAVEPASLLPEGPHELWKDDEPSRRVAELAVAFARYSRLPKLLRPEVVLETVLRGVKEGLLVARQPRPDGTARTFWREEVDPDARKDPALEAVLPEHAGLTRLGAAMLDPKSPALPGLWSDDIATLGGVLRYFGGDHEVTVPKQGFEETLTVPRCDPGIVRAAVAAAVQAGRVWLVHAPTSLWKDPVPETALREEAILRPAPSLIGPADLGADALPDAWEGGKTNGTALREALGAKRGEILPWGLVRESIRAAVNTDWLEITEGELNCSYAQAGKLTLGKPKQLSAPAPTPTSVPGARLESAQLEDLVDECADLTSIGAGYGLRFRIAVEFEHPIDDDLRTKVNEILARIHPDLRLK